MNKIRIKELEALKKEAAINIERLETYVSGRNLCDVQNEYELIKKNKQTIINLDGLIKTLNH